MECEVRFKYSVMSDAMFVIGFSSIIWGFWCLGNTWGFFGTGIALVLLSLVPYLRVK